MSCGLNCLSPLLSSKGFENAEFLLSSFHVLFVDPSSCHSLFDVLSFDCEVWNVVFNVE